MNNWTWQVARALNLLILLPTNVYEIVNACHRCMRTAIRKPIHCRQKTNCQFDFLKCLRSTRYVFEWFRTKLHSLGLRHSKFIHCNFCSHRARFFASILAVNDDFHLISIRFRYDVKRCVSTPIVTAHRYVQQKIKWNESFAICNYRG